MIKLTIFNFILYIFLTWGTNILLNFLYVIKRYYPKVISLDRPIDRGLKYNGDRIVGESTTIIGLIVSITASSIVYLFSQDLVLASIPTLVYFGHLIGSVIKRRMHKKDGEFVPFVDHGDYIVFTGLVLVVLGVLSFRIFILSIVFTYIFHPLACKIAFRLRLRENPY